MSGFTLAPPEDLIRFGVGTSRIFDKTLSRVFDLIREVAMVLWVGCGVGMVRLGVGWVSLG
jgi:hypothetical protein